MSDTELEEYFESGMTDGIFDSLKFSQEAKPLPCWCRGMERTPLEELPLFQYLKEQNRMLSRNGLVTNGYSCQGLGRGRPRADLVMAGSQNGSSSSDDDDDLNRVGQYWRRQRPLAFGATQPPVTNGYATKPLSLVAPEVRRPPPQTEGGPQPRHAVGARPSPSEPAPTARPASAAAGSSGEGKARVVGRRVPKSRKGSFNPQEYSLSYGLDHWAQTHASKGAPSSNDAEKSDDSDDAFPCDDDRGSSASSSSPPTSSAEDGAADRATSSARRPTDVLEIANVPPGVTSDALSEVLSLYGAVDGIVLGASGAADQTAEVTMSKDVDLHWVARCLQTQSPFSASSEPLAAKVLGKTHGGRTDE